MKKWIFLVGCLAMMHSVLAEDGLVGSGEYKIVSDIRDKNIAPGKFVVEGVVKNAQTGVPMPGVQYGQFETMASYFTDSLGRFSLLCDTAENQTIFFYSSGWSEINIVRYPFKSQHRVTVSVSLEKAEPNAIKRKPVIYCYAEKELNASLILDPKGAFTFTYPAYNNGWNVTVDPAGGLTDLNTGKNYPYLFWEAASENLSYQTTENGISGFVIHTDSTIQFLEDKLSALGLNQTEQTDFITFWGPILQKQPYALIQFLVDDAYESDIASLQISPQPDAMRRVYILFSPLENEQVGMPVIAQQLQSFERFGFTVVEWGGSELDLTWLIPH
jgi:hypothetical protein